ncbi:acetate uptake transporter [Methanimicrococcus blatticola]|uniref:Transcriptional regulator n=1 Tax=Methanimicrococcus blatticola TaxID=91560 RepID=A0A484F7M4_9EURY|nr:acetate uptake transporter [Methanimicrococcus blatticola]MBZ3936212.1 acetate uptake transporter [Methanimicrococcus blatticola]MCC2508455.1 acetate uptake transporter [Methanimicrococcus blatticola]TDQ70094.1 transcriptional regulator [Methanimicrococcus blatticola]
MSEQVIKIADTTGNPGALGLTGFSLATLTLSFHNMGLVPENMTVIAMAIFVGGLAQLLAGMMAWKKGNTFETVAFTGFGVFWLSFAFILIAPLGTAAAGDFGLALYLLLWGIFGLGLLLGTLKMGVKALVVVFTLLVLTFFMTAAFHFVLIPIVGVIAGFFAFLLGAAAFYTAMAIVLNEVGYKLPM